MELGVPSEDFFDPFAPQGIFRHVDKPFEGGNLFFGNPSTDDPQGVPFQNCPELEEVVDLLRGVAGDAEPAGFQGFDQPVLFEFVEGLPHRGAADPQLLGKMLLRKTFTGGKPSGKDT